MPSSHWLRLLLCLFAGFSCASENLWEAAGRVSAKGFRRFHLAAAKNPALAADIEGVITGTEITLHARREIDRTRLVPDFLYTGERVLIGSNRQASGVTTNDFSMPLLYTVAAIDGSTIEYLVSVDTNPLPDPFISGAYARLHNYVGSYGVPDGIELPYIGVRYDAAEDLLEFRVAAQHLQGLPGFGESPLGHLGPQGAADFAAGKDGIAFAMLPDLQAWLVADPAHQHGEVVLWNTRAKRMEKLPDGSFRLRVRRGDLVSANQYWAPMFFGMLVTKVLFTSGGTVDPATAPFYVSPIGYANCVIPYGDIPGFPDGGFRVAGTRPAGGAVGISGMAPILVCFTRTVTIHGTIELTEAGTAFGAFSATWTRNRLLIRPSAPLEDQVNVAIGGAHDAGGNQAPDYSFSYQAYRPHLIQFIEVRDYAGQKTLAGTGMIDSPMLGKNFHLYGEADFHNLNGGWPDPDWQSRTHLGSIPAGFIPVVHTLSLPFPVIAGARYWLRLSLDPALSAPPYWGQLEDDAIYLHVLSAPVPAAPVKRLVLDLGAGTASWANY